MTTISIEEAQAKLPDLIHHLHAGDEVVITENDQPVARLVPAPSESLHKPRQPGMLKGSVLYMAPDFDAPLEDFKDYMEEGSARYPRGNLVGPSGQTLEQRSA
ncbi:MAG TPA: type II toxin-antitoxin system Phd/YefM family antitoxin [Thermoanaerobaculia bacterium]|jgi:antitoxin (DNA-binding transcriptional repressor) of toxin-antitoxin stability system|nr:type II toxin-antitoxin system Phd/YefM family antitoxin [Thermoanaerobaculia bacterium]